MVQTPSVDINAALCQNIHQQNSSKLTTNDHISFCDFLIGDLLKISDFLVFLLYNLSETYVRIKNKPKKKTFPSPGDNP